YLSIGQASSVRPPHFGAPRFGPTRRSNLGRSGQTRPRLAARVPPYGFLAVPAAERGAGKRCSWLQTYPGKRGRLAGSPSTLSRDRPHPVSSGVGIALDLPHWISVPVCTLVTLDS